MLHIIAWLFISQPVQAIVMEPVIEAAESLGYRVAGELEFTTGSIRHRGMKESLKQVGEFCPRTQAFDRRVSTETRFVILAWPDLEYPGPGKRDHSLEQQKLAAHRAEAIADVLRNHVGGHLFFELVNMATRRPHLVRVTEAGRIQKSRDNVKETLELAGGAPSDRLGMGLFGEYSQRAKAVIWVDCYESLVKRRRNVPTLVELAGVRGQNLKSRGTLWHVHTAALF